MSYTNLIKRSLHTSRLLSFSPKVKLTLFSKPQCGLCEHAKEIIDDVLDKPEFPKDDIKMEIINITQINNKKWWELYCFDIPVLHVQKTDDPSSLFKIFHRIDEDILEEKIKTCLK